jgi:hypothetical protein
VAKKKSTKKKDDPLVNSHMQADSAFANVVGDVERKSKKKDRLVGMESLMHILPVPALSIRVLLQNEGLPLDAMYQLVGEQGSFKSTTLAEFFRWIRLCGGVNMLAEAESKDQDDLRQAILGYDPGAVRVEECESMEAWQDKITWYTLAMQKEFSKVGGPGRTVIAGLGVDSLTGKASEATIKKVKEAGHATLGFPVEANLLNTYMKTFPSMMTGWPFLFMGVNHLKIKIDALTGQVDYNIPGGAALKFQCLMIIMLTKFGSVKQYKNYHEANLQFETLKNNAGADRVRVQVKLRIWQVDGRTHARFEWWEASILLLMKGVGMRKAVADILLPRIKEVLDLHEKSAGNKGKMFWSKRLGVESADAMPAHDLGVKLEQRSDILGELYPILGVRRRPFFQPGVDYMKQLEDYSHVADQADAAHQKLQSMQEELIAGHVGEASVTAEEAE